MINIITMSVKCEIIMYIIKSRSISVTCFIILSVHRAINSGLGSIIPKSIQKAVLEGVFSLGMAQLSDYVLNEKNPVGAMRLEKLKKIFEEGKSLQLQFPAHDLGFWSDF